MPATCPQHVGVMLDGNRRWAKAVGARHRPRSPRRRRQHRAAARLVRRGRHRGRHPVAALHRQPQPARRPSSSRCSTIIEDAVDSLADQRRWRLHPVGALDLLPADIARAAQGRRGGDPRRRRDAGQHRRRLRRPPRDRRRRPLAAARARRDGHLAGGARRDHRRRAHRRPPLHQGPARPRPRDPHLGRAAPRRVPAVAERASRSSTSARPTGPTSAGSTSCARSAPTPCASAATAPERVHAVDPPRVGSVVTRTSPGFGRVAEPARSAYVRSSGEWGSSPQSGGPFVRDHDRRTGQVAGRSCRARVRRAPALRRSGSSPGPPALTRGPGEGARAVR